MRLPAALFTFLFIVVFLIPCAESSVISISRVSIDPQGGYEDSSTHEWRGSFWVITATVDTLESYLLFNATTSTLSGLNSVEDKTIVPTSTIKITVRPRQPYWEIPLVSKTYMVYPKTNGTDLAYWRPDKLTYKSQNSVPELNITVLETSPNDVWGLYTPFDVTVEKEGHNSFKQTVQFNKTGGTDTIVVSNPADNSESLMIQDLGKLRTGLEEPRWNEALIIGKSLVFEKNNELIHAIEYPSWPDELTPNVDENFALYWFGGGNYYKSGENKVKCWDDEKSSPKHVSAKSLWDFDYESIVEEGDFPGSHRLPDTTGLGGIVTWKHVEPIAASIFENNTSTTPNGLSLVAYLKQNFPTSLLDLDQLYGQDWAITGDSKLRIDAPSFSSSSLITLKISSELADSVVYQPPIAYGRCEQAYWNSTKTTSCTVTEGDTAILKVKQFSSKSSKITVTPSVPSDIPISISPIMDGAILDPDSTHDFIFQVRNLGAETERDTCVTFTIKNELGTVTDTQTLALKLMPHAAPNRPSSVADGYPLWILLGAVAAIACGTVASYLFYRSYSSRKKGVSSSPHSPEPAPPLRTKVTGTTKIRVRKRILFACFTLVLIAGLGVYYYDAYPKLGFSAVGVGLGDVSYTSAEIRLILEISNPNLLPIFVPSGGFDIYLNNQHLAYGSFGSLFLAGGSTGRITVPVTFSATDVPFLIYGIVTGGGKATVRLEGAAHLVLFEIPFSTTLADATFT